MTVYFVNSGKFGDGRHNNSAKEWLAMPLRGKASPPPRLFAMPKLLSFVPGRSME